MQLPTRDEGSFADAAKLKQQQIGTEMIKVNLCLPDGTVESYSVETAKEIGYVKGMHVKASGGKVRGISSVKFIIGHDGDKGGREMIDPLSLCDFPEVCPPEVNIRVEYQGVIN